MTPASRALLVIAHYFREETGGQYSSTSGEHRAQRRTAIERTLLAWRSLFSPCRYLHWRNRRYEVRRGSTRLDIMVIVHQDNHLLDEQMLARYQVRPQRVDTESPRMLPFGAHKLIKLNAEAYDWFIYSEDDLLPHDPSMLQKQALFQQRFGMHRLLQPNRYEISGENRLPKTYVDGDLAAHQTRALWSHVREDQPDLGMTTDLGEVRFSRARNPHAGCFMLSRAQAMHWVRQPHFLDLDCSFVSPLESAGSLSLLKTFSLYKASSPLAYLELEHQDRKFSSYPWTEYVKKANLTHSSPPAPQD